MPRAELVLWRGGGVEEESGAVGGGRRELGCRGVRPAEIRAQGALGASGERGRQVSGCRGRCLAQSRRGSSQERRSQREYCFPCLPVDRPSVGSLP